MAHRRSEHYIISYYSFYFLLYFFFWGGGGGGHFELLDIDLLLVLYSLPNYHEQCMGIVVFLKRVNFAL